jgi:DNA uptake protein ComE-like DNA-binding protein
MIASLLAALLLTAMDPAVPAAETVSAPVEQAPPKARKKSNKPAMTGVLNVNRATEAELRLLPGIGKRRAELILERREKKPFASLEEVGRIKGLRAIVQRLHAHLSVQGDSTLHPLTAAPAKR